VGGLFAPHVTPLSKLYSTLKPVTAEGGVTIKGPQPEFTTGAGGAGGNTTAFIVVSWHNGSGLVEPAGMVPQFALNRYLALMVQHPGVFDNRLFTWFRFEFHALNVPPGACTAYSAVNPETASTAVMSASFVLQLFDNGVITGDGGKITTLTALL
jgi:hypothetical protein